MTSIDRRFLDLAGLSEPDPPQPSGLYSSAIAHDGLVWVSGHSGKADGKVVFTGRLGADCTHEDGVEAARLACITALSSASALLNGLSRIARPLKLTGYVKSAQDFHDQAQIVDGRRASCSICSGGTKVRTHGLPSVSPNCRAERRWRSPWCLPQPGKIA